MRDLSTLSVGAAEALAAPDAAVLNGFRAIPFWVIVVNGSLLHDAESIYFRRGRRSATITMQRIAAACI